MTLTKEQFSAICFLTLMEHHGEGVIEAHPNYIGEKLPMLKMDYGDAYGMLDSSNQAKVREHVKKWGYVMPVTWTN